jgi:hypothetical protein
MLHLLVVGALIGPVAAVAQAPPQAANPTAKPAAKPAKSAATGDSVDYGWPRQIPSGGTTFTVYQPQLEKWEGDRLELRSAVAVKEAGAEEPTYGVIALVGRTEVDKVNRQVYINDAKITEAKFPSQAGKEGEWRAALQKAVPPRSKAIALDRLEAQLAIQEQTEKASERPLKNDPPEILISSKAAMLIPVDGEPALRDAGSGVQRVINTRPLLLKKGDTWYLHVFDGWLQASSLTDSWAVAKKPPSELKKAMDAAVKSGQVDLLTGESGDSTQPKPTLAKGPVPAIYVRTKPAELLVFEGEPVFEPVDSTQLLYAKNTTARVFKSITDNKTYVVVSGRWYRAASLKGPWTYVAGTELPKDFAKIPDSSPVENVKASVPGTPQAQEAVIANSIPQTASVKRSTKMEPPPKIDGEPQIKPIEGTSLKYVLNASVPVIQVKEKSYYSVQNGVWFVAPSVKGPWSVADSVPAAIYSIPTSSPLHYVTYVKVYQTTPEVVYVGYTPGYYGTVVAPYGTVVYGTGYYYTPWIGTYWYPPPVTYGWGVGMAWTPWTGWGFTFGFGWGAAYAWGGWGWGPMPYWGPAAWGWGYGGYGYYGGAAYGPRGGYARWGPGGWYGTTGNVYSRYGSNNVVSRTSGGFNAYTGNRWSSTVGRSYNSRTGTISAGQRASVGNVYTGGYQSTARGAARNPTTGVAAAGRSTTVGNAYTGRQATAGQGVVYDPRTGQSVDVRGVQGERGGAAQIGNTTVARSGDDVYAGKNGEVYRRDGSGNWQQQSGSGWQNSSGADRSTLDRDAGARSAGDARAQGYNRTGSYAGSGGGRMGGGARMGGGGRRR